MAANVYHLSILQLFNYALPLATIPYVVRVIGIDNFGLLAYATAICSYFFLLINYGFDLSATNKIAVNTDDKEIINRVFCAVTVVKVLLSLLSVIFLVLLLLVIPSLAENWEIYMYCLMVVVAQSLIPVWLFQGISQMKKITKYSVASKLVATLGIFTFVNDRSDFYMIPVLTAAGFFIAGIVSIVSVKRELGLNFFIPKRSELISALRSGFHIFLSKIFVSFYSATNVIILGSFTNVSVVGSYSLAEKITGAFSGLFVPVTQALFPYMSKLYQDAKQQYDKLFKLTQCCVVMMAAIIIIAILFYSELIVRLVAGEDVSDAALVLCIISISIASSPLGTLFSQGLIIRGLQKQLLVVIFFTLVINLILIIPLTLQWGLYGMATTILVTQLFHLLMHFSYYYRLSR